MFLHNQFSFDDRLQLPRDKNSNLVSKLLRLETPHKLLLQKIKRFQLITVGINTSSKSSLIQFVQLNLSEIEPEPVPD